MFVRHRPSGERLRGGRHETSWRQKTSATGRTSKGPGTPVSRAALRHHGGHQEDDGEKSQKNQKEVTHAAETRLALKRPHPCPSTIATPAWWQGASTPVQFPRPPRSGAQRRCRRGARDPEGTASEFCADPNRASRAAVLE